MTPRRSLVGPAILIALGVLFLANNVLPDFNFFHLIGSYWPFLLIAWGVLRLIEVLALAATSRPLPIRGLSGGEVFLIVLICVFGAVSTGVSRHMPNIHIGNRGREIFGESFDYPLTLQRVVGAKQRIVFDNLRGNVRVTGVDGTDLKVTGRKTIRAFDRAEADRNNEKTPLEAVIEGDRLVVRTNQDRIAENRHISADLEVTVPRGATIEGRGRTGDFEISEIDGAVDIIADNAGVRLSRIGGDSKVELRRSDIVRAVDMKGNVEVISKGSAGDIEFENIEGRTVVNGSFGGSLEFKNLAKPFRFESRNTEIQIEKLPGRISMNLGNLTAQNLVGPVRLNSKSKDIKIEEFTEGLELEVERGDVEIRTGKVVPKITARCLNTGNIELAVPESAKFDLTATTERGEAHNDFGEGIRIENDGRTSVLRGKLGSGPPVQLSTKRGTVTIRKE